MLWRVCRRHREQAAFASSRTELLRTARQWATASISSYSIRHPLPSLLPFKSLIPLPTIFTQTPVSRQPQPLATVSRHTWVPLYFVAVYKQLPQCRCAWVDAMVLFLFRPLSQRTWAALRSGPMVNDCRRRAFMPFLSSVEACWARPGKCLDGRCRQ